jgi:membrane-bound lytic murein transglycosylase MltF
VTGLKYAVIVTALTCVGAVAGCAGPGETSGAQAAVDGQTEETQDVRQALPESSEAPPETLAGTNEPRTGDLDVMIERRVIRALVTYNSTNFFFDGARPRGISYEGLKTFEEYLNKKLGTGHLKVHVVFIPTRRDRLIPALREGLGDIAAANLTITPARRELVDFSIPSYAGVDEVVVTGPKAPTIASLEDLAGQEVWVRASSSYFESLQRLNENFRERGLDPVVVREADEQLETEDLLEMVASGLLGITVADDYLTELWAEVLDGLVVHSDLVLHADGEIGWMFRQDSPELAAAVNDFTKANKKGTLMGNILFKRYFENTKWVKNAVAAEDLERSPPRHTRSRGSTRAWSVHPAPSGSCSSCAAPLRTRTSASPRSTISRTTSMPE